MNETRVNLTTGVEQAWTSFMTFLPNFVGFLAILIIGYFAAKLLAKLLDKGLERVGFDRLVERGPVKKALDQTQFDASDILSKIVFYAIMLFVLQLGFGVFGPNPMSNLLNGFIAYLPNILFAVIIVIIAGAIAAAAKQLIGAALGGVSYGRHIASAASAAILIVGIFAALDELNIAPNIVNGLFYAALAIIVGSAIISIGVGGIGPMRGVWERAMGRVQEEAPRLKAEAEQAPQRVGEKVQSWEQQAKQEIPPDEGRGQETRRFKT